MARFESGQGGGNTGGGFLVLQTAEQVGRDFFGKAAIRAKRSLKPDTPLLPLIAALGSVVVESNHAANAGRKRVPDWAQGKRKNTPIGVSPDWFLPWPKEVKLRNLVSELFTQGSVGGRQVTAASTRPAELLPFRL